MVVIPRREARSAEPRRTAGHLPSSGEEGGRGSRRALRARTSPWRPPREPRGSLRSRLRV